MKIGIIGLGYFYFTNVTKVTSTINSVGDQLLLSSQDLRNLKEYPLVQGEPRIQIENFENFILENKEQIDETVDLLSDQIVNTLTSIKELTVEDILSEENLTSIDAYSDQLASYGSMLKQTVNYIPYVSIYTATSFVMLILMGAALAILASKTTSLSTSTQADLREEK